MAKRTAITRDFYEKLLIAFRECPGNASFAARRALCDSRTAIRAWRKGWPDRDLPPIEKALENEKIEAQAAARKAVLAASEAAEAQRELARQEAIESKKQEQQILKVARGDVLAALVLGADLVVAMRAAVAAIKRELEMKPDGSPPDIKPIAAMQLLARHSQLIQRAVGAAEAVIQLSRLDRGATTAHIGIGGVEEDLSPEQIDEELEAIADVLTATRSTLTEGANGVTGVRGALAR